MIEEQIAAQFFVRVKFMNEAFKNLWRVDIVAKQTCQVLVQGTTSLGEQQHCFG